MIDRYTTELRYEMVTAGVYLLRLPGYAPVGYVVSYTMRPLVRLVYIL